MALREGAGAPAEGDLVERDIDGVWFMARVIEVHEDRNGTVVDLQYTDDGNLEYDVLWEELRHVTDVGKIEEHACESKEEPLEGKEDEGEGEGTASPKVIPDLIEKSSRPGSTACHEPDFAPDLHGTKVTIHSSASYHEREDGSAGAYIINGPESNIAAGSGLRALRWLRPT